MKTIKLLMALALAGVMFVSCGKDNGGAGNGAGTNINVLNEIKDPNIKAYVKLSMEMGWIESKEPGFLTKYEAARVTDLNLTNIKGCRDVTTLAGIEYFTGLKRLQIHYTAVSLVDLTHNTNLTYLSIAGCTAGTMKIISPSITQLYGKYSENGSLEILAPRLRDIDLSYCQKLTAIDVSACPGLEVLKCGGCRINSIDVENNKNLALLWCGGAGNLSSGSMDISKNKKLTSFSCDQGATAIRKLYVWWEGGSENLPEQLMGEDKYGPRFHVNSRTEIIMK